jgi:Nif-specific regulatory protein
MEPLGRNPATSSEGAREPNQADRLRGILNVCRKMTSVREVPALQDLITQEAKALMGVDRVSMFLFDRERCELWSVISQEKGVMRLDARLGIAGRVAMTGETINVADAYEHPLFYKEVDIQTGYRTRTLLAVPLKNLKGQIIGVCEAVNKNQGTFNDEDIEILETLAAHAADAFETAEFHKFVAASGAPLSGRTGQHQKTGFSTQNIVGMSHRIQGIIRLIDQIRDSSVDVLIQGESGTGKELVAMALHYNSPRADGPFVALNCAALPDNLVESELFGIEKGVATGVDRRIGKFEQAEGGTLFLDEIGDLSLTAQAKILRVLQERYVDRVGGKKPEPINVRVIAATNRDLLAAIKERTFREDLYYRLKVIHVQTPPLRDVPEDIPFLANHFLAKYCQTQKTEPKEFTPAALECLSQYPWPGNARQLENEVKRLVATVRGKTINADNLDVIIRSIQRNSHEEATEGVVSTRSLPAAVENLERQLIEQAIRDCGGNKQKAAQLLGLSRQGLIKKMKRLTMMS